MSDLESDLREEFAREASAVQGLPRDLWLRIVERPGAGAPTWLKMVPVAVAALFVVVAGLFLARAQRPNPPGGGPVAAASASASPGAGAKASPQPRVTPQVSPSASGPAFGCGAAPSGGAASATGNLTAIRVAHQPGFDRVTFEFAGTGIPAYTVTQQASTHFTQDASGRPVDVQGIAALKIVFRNASGSQTYTGSTDIKLAPGGVPDKSSIVELREVGDFERVLSWAVGMNVKPGCLQVHEYASPARLAVDVQDNQ